MSRLAIAGTAATAALLLSACATGDAGEWRFGPQPGEQSAPGSDMRTNEAGIEESYRRSFEGCGLTTQQDAVLRPAYRRWTINMGDVILRDPSLIFRLLFAGQQRGGEIAAKALTPATREWANAVQTTLRPEQQACFRANQERWAARGRG